MVKSIQLHPLTLILVVVIYSVSQFIYEYVFSPNKGSFLETSVVLSQLFYLPQGVAIITTWLHRSAAVGYLFVAGLIHHSLLGHDVFDFHSMATIVSLALFPYLVMAAFTLCGLNVYLMPGLQENHMWRTIILVSFVCSAITALFDGFVASLFGATDAALLLVSKGLMGGLSGTFLCLLFIYMAFKLMAIYMAKAAAKNK